MTLIPCTNDCLYQADGYCALEQAATSSLPQSAAGPCVNYVPRKNSDQSGQCFSDIMHPNQL